MADKAIRLFQTPGPRVIRQFAALTRRPKSIETVPKICIVGTVDRLRGRVHMAKSHLRLVRPRTVNGTVPPRRRKNAELRTREYLTEAEVERLMKAARDNRYGLRDATIILMAFRHGLR